MKEKIKQLWKLCFNDSDEFTELYFRLRYREERNLALEQQGEMIAAMQLLPYPMTFGGEIVPTNYVSGACTHPAYRKQGAMKRLLTEAFNRMYKAGTMFSTLIPAEPWLFEFYGKLGYSPVFKQSSSRFVCPAQALPAEAPELQTIHNYEELCCFLHRKQEEREGYLCHTAEDFLVILADIRLSNGRIFTLKEQEKIVAMAITHPNEYGKWQVDELLYEEASYQPILLQRICEELSLSGLEVITPPTPQTTSRPLGMARLINAEAMLQRHAAHHPEEELHIQLTDEQLPVNNGCYTLQHGKCIKTAGQLSSKYPTISISELTERLLSPLKPYMNLMLN
ncbi:MAG: GNAT family N-acetyltransferase [Bacteroides sp.]|nr:GNAT family N-acetyltransferase [Bacteroides sp.]MBO5014799.1 GNAT family N-acetyltransferase [Bacteroidaceae bacterium]